MANVIKASVENPEELLNAGMYGAGAIIRLQSATTEAGAYANESTASLVTGTNAYTLYDADGTSTTWYRSRYENAGGTSVSDWSTAFQVGGEEGGLICSLYDVKQRLGILPSVTTSDEEILDLIRAETDEIERVTGRDFTGERSDSTFRVDTCWGRTLWLPKGIQSVTTLTYAVNDQPATGGTYTTIASTGYALRPSATERAPYWPATEIALLSTSGAMFYDAINGAEITGKRGFAEVPPSVARIGATAVVNQFLTKGSSGPRAVIGPDGRATILRDISPADWATLMSVADPSGAAA